MQLINFLPNYSNNISQIRIKYKTECTLITFDEIRCGMGVPSETELCEIQTAIRLSEMGWKWIQKCLFHDFLISPGFSYSASFVQKVNS